MREFGAAGAVALPRLAFRRKRAGRTAVRGYARRPVSQQTLEEFMARVEASVAEGTFVRLNLGIPVNREGIRNVFVRPVARKEGRMLSFLYR